MCHGKAQNVTIELHKNTFIDLGHWMAQNVPQHCTKCATALHKSQNVPQHCTKCATAWHKLCYSTAAKYLCATGTHKNVSYHGTKRLLGRFCFFYIRKKIYNLYYNYIGCSARSHRSNRVPQRSCGRLCLDNIYIYFFFGKKIVHLKWC
jgi:hypothetical protein